MFEVESNTQFHYTMEIRFRFYSLPSLEWVLDYSTSIDGAGQRFVADQVAFVFIKRRGQILQSLSLHL